MVASDYSAHCPQQRVTRSSTNSTTAAKHMNATKVLAVSLAIAAASTLGVAMKLDEPPGAAAVLTPGGLDAQRRRSLPRAGGGRIMLDVSRRTFRFPWPLVED